MRGSSVANIAATFAPLRALLAGRCGALELLLVGPNVAAGRRRVVVVPAVLVVLVVLVVVELVVLVETISGSTFDQLSWEVFRS